MNSQEILDNLQICSEINGSLFGWKDLANSNATISIDFPLASQISGEFNLSGLVVDSLYFNFDLLQILSGDLLIGGHPISSCNVSLSFPSLSEIDKRFVISDNLAMLSISSPNDWIISNLVEISNSNLLNFDLLIGEINSNGSLVLENLGGTFSISLSTLQSAYR